MDFLQLLGLIYGISFLLVVPFTALWVNIVVRWKGEVGNRLRDLFLSIFLDHTPDSFREAIIWVSFIPILNTVYCLVVLVVYYYFARLYFTKN